MQKAASFLLSAILLTLESPACYMSQEMKDYLRARWIGESARI